MLDAEQAADPLLRQVLTSRNIRGGPFTDAALGGLNYQIEHHLFPSMPRANLRRAQPVVQRVLRGARDPLPRVLGRRVVRRRRAVTCTRSAASCARPDGMALGERPVGGRRQLSGPSSR